jgi:hypothetical protein
MEDCGCIEHSRTRQTGRTKPETEAFKGMQLYAGNELCCQDCQW